MGQLFWVLLITVVTGPLGGFAAYLIDPISSNESSAETKKQTRTRYLVLGLVAASAVPLFLSLLQSEILTNIFEPRRDAVSGATLTPFGDFLIFAGFCLIAAISARAFIDTLSQRVLEKKVEVALEASAKAEKKAEEANRKADQAEERSAVASDLIQESIEARPEIASMAVQGDEANDQDAPPALSDAERAVLGTMMNVSFRTATGVGHDAGTSRRDAAAILTALTSKRLVERSVSPRTGGFRWRITPLGARALNRQD